MTHRWERIALAAALAVALGSACSSGDNGSGQGNVMNGGAGGQTANASGSGNSAGQAGATAQGGNGQPGGGTANGGGATSSSGGAGGSAGSGATVSGGAAGKASSGGAPSGGATSNRDGGSCCKTADCQPDDVKTCVCTQWQQSQCCSSGGGWDTFCQATAEGKCNAEKCLTTTEPPPDAGPTPDAGHIIKGACCAIHSTPGCDDAATESCICDLVKTCCTDQWDAPCVQLVREKHCEAGVRDCVCTTWQQQSCCDTAWTDACGIVATTKCNAQPECP